MAKTTILIGGLLCVLGFVSYAMGGQSGTAERSPTALIPAGFGAILALLGLFVLAKPTLRKHLMHVAVTISLLGLLASLPMGIMGLVRKGLALAPVSQMLMAILCGIHVLLSVRSFIAARRAREGAEQA